MLEDGVQHRTGALDEPFDMRVDGAVDVRQEEKLLVSLDHEPREMHGTELVLRCCEIGHQRGQLLGECPGTGGRLDREVDGEMALAHIVFPRSLVLPFFRNCYRVLAA